MWSTKPNLSDSPQCTSWRNLPFRHVLRHPLLLSIGHAIFPSAHSQASAPACALAWWVRHGAVTCHAVRDLERFACAINEVTSRANHWKMIRHAQQFSSDSFGVMTSWQIHYFGKYFISSLLPRTLRSLRTILPQSIAVSSRSRAQSTTALHSHVLFCQNT